MTIGVDLIGDILQRGSRNCDVLSGIELWFRERWDRIECVTGATGD